MISVELHGISERISVLEFQSDGQASRKSVAVYQKPVEDMRQFSLRLRVRLNRLRDQNTLVSYAVQDNSNELQICESFICNNTLICTV